MLKEAVEKVLITEEEIQHRIAEMGEQITRDFAGKRPLAVCVLKGAWMFTADLLRRIDLPVDIDFICVSSYGGGTCSTGNVKIVRDLMSDCAGRDVLIIEDIIDSGITLENLKQLLYSRRANSVSIATLLSKPSRREVDVDVAYIGFTIPDEFVIGYGMDYAEKYRNLPEVCTIKRSLVK